MPRPNHRLVKVHRTYTVQEVGRLFGVHRNTVREWIKHGLPAIDDRRPVLIHGRDLGEYLTRRRQQGRRPCRAGEMFCLRCRTPRHPAGNLVDYVSRTATLGTLVGICPVCETVMYRSLNPGKLAQVRGILDVAEPKAERDIVGTSGPSLNSDFG